MLLDPTSIGRYTVHRALGRGAMGAVWLATDPLLKRQVAIKTLLNPAADDVATIMERFRREAEISARLNHPNVITIFDVGSDPKVGPFLAMEYIDGASLASLARKGLPVETTLRLLIQGMSGLMAAGQAGIVHRDVKPENMLVSREGRLKLMDFGIARANESHLTQAGMVFGTPSYTAPELLKGLEATPATDQYAFVVTCLEALTGTLPFLGTSVASTLYKVVHEPPDLPLEMEASLRDVFLRALAKDPADRYPDLPAFLGGLVEAVMLPEATRARLRAILEGDEPVNGTLAMLPMGTATPARGLPKPPALPEAELPPEPEPTAADSGPWSGRKRWLGVAAAVLLGAGGWLAWSVLMVRTHPLTIHTDPPGAAAFLNGKPIGKTPLEAYPIREGRPPGLLRLELEGYAAQQVELEADDRILEYTLKRPGFEVALATEPAGADILLDGVSLGHTPARVEVPGGGAQVVLRLAGHQDATVELKPGAPPPATIPLVSDTYRVAVTSDPPGAEVFMDALPVGRTPLAALDIKGSKAHALRLKKAGFQDWTGLVEKGKGLPQPIRMEPAKGRGQ